MNLFYRYMSKLPLIALLISNALPLVGVLFFGWDAFLVVLLYWAENVVIGFYNVLKMLFVKVYHPAKHLSKIYKIPFFIVHYGSFTAVHGFVVLAIFKQNASFSTSREIWPLFIMRFLFEVIVVAFNAIPNNAKFILVAMFISHGISFGYNYFYRGEYASIKLEKLMKQPYARIVVLHFTILFGGSLTDKMGSPIGLLVMLVILKTFLDVVLHQREHKPGKD